MPHTPAGDTAGPRRRTRLLLGDRALVRERDLAALARRLHDRQAHLEGGHAPAAVVVAGPVLDHGVVQLLQLGVARGGAPDHGHLRLAIVAVDEQAGGRLADVAALAGSDGDAEHRAAAGEELPPIRALVVRPATLPL